MINHALGRLLAVGCVGAALAFISAASAETISTAPKLFAPEADWPAGRDASPAFTPDGKTVFFTHGEAAYRGIMVSHLKDGVWSKPAPAPFSGTWRDIEPYMAPDGSYLIFISNRPAEPGGAPLDGYFSGKAQPKAGGNLWRVDRRGEGWGEPVRLPDIVNSNSAIYSPAVVSDGSLYFNQPDPVTRKSHIYRAQAIPGGFQAPVAVSVSDGMTPGYDVAAAPDDSFIVFSSGRPPAKPGQSLVFIAFRKDGDWTTPKPFDPPLDGIEARFSPDLKTLYVQMDVPAPGAAPDAQTQGRIFEVPFQP